MQERAAKTTVTRSPSESLPSLRSLGLPKWERLVAACGYSERLSEAVDLFDLLTHGWAHQPALARPSWQTDITDDGSPFEFSVAIDGQHFEPRILAEPWAGGAPQQSFAAWLAGLEQNQRLQATYGADFGRFAAVRGLFEAPVEPLGSFRLWHAAALDSAGGVTSKVYLNPRCEMDPLGQLTARRAMAALGLSQAVRFCDARLGPSANVVYFSLDSLRASHARAKIYVADPELSVAELETFLVQTGIAAPGSIVRRLEVLVADSPSLGARPLLVCYAFTAGVAQPAVTVHVPIREYVEHDEQALQRATQLLDRIAARRVRELVTAVAGRPLDMGRALITYVSLRPSAEDVRMALYLSPELYGIAAPRCQTRSDEARVSMIRALAPRGERHEELEYVQERVAAATTAVPEVRLPDLQAVRELIDVRRVLLERHPLLCRLEQPISVEQARVIAQGVAFFVMSFQDVLRLVAGRIRDPQLATLAKIFQVGDRGHDRWYLRDLKRLGTELDAAWLFGTFHHATRDAAYAIVAAALGARHDQSLISLLLALEASGQDFFPKMVQALAPFEREQPFEFFGRRHLAAEAGHDPFDADSDVLPELPVPREASTEIGHVVERVFGAVESMASGIQRALSERAA